MGWVKWRTSGLSCDRRMPLGLKGNFYRTSVRLAMMYGPDVERLKNNLLKGWMRLR